MSSVESQTQQGLSRFRKTLAAIAGVCSLVFSASSASAAPMYVANSGSGTVSVVDSQTGAIINTIILGGLPEKVAITPDGSIAIVTVKYSNMVKLINVATNTVVASIPVAGSPDAIAVSADGTKAFITHYLAAGEITPIDLVNQTALAPIYTGQGNLVSAKFAPDGHTLYVVSHGNGSSPGSVIPVNTLTQAVGTPILVQAGALDLAFTPDGTKLFVTNQNGESVSQIDVATNTVTRTISNVGGLPRAIVITPDGLRAFVGVVGGVRVINVLGLLRNSLGPYIGFSYLKSQCWQAAGSVSGLALTADGSKAWGTAVAVDRVFPIDVATHASACGEEVVVGDRPTGVAIAPQ